MIGSPPLRFLAVIVGGWMCVRGAIMAFDAVAVAPLAVASAPAAAAIPARAVTIEPTAAPVARSEMGRPSSDPPRFAFGRTSAPAAATPLAWRSSFAVSRPGPIASTRAGPAAVGPAPAFAPLMRIDPPRRWSVYSWAFFRHGDRAALATGGNLGASQAGVRAVYRLTDRVAAAARLSTPLDGPGAEAAMGIEWTPIAGAPLRLLVERREELDRGGRSAFALTLHGGLDPTKLGPVEVEAFGQAGAVGINSRDLFVDGAVAAGFPVNETVRVGAGVWGAAQPGAARLDAGPQIVARVPLGKVGVRAAAEWRFRVAGDAAPASGPALTVSAGF